jgi:hypothetical protein
VELNNDINYTDSGIDHDKFSFGLKKSLFNFMHGICFDYQLQDWFDFKIQRLKFLPILFFDALEDEDFNSKPTAKIVWLGGKPSIKFTKSKIRGIRQLFMIKASAFKPVRGGRMVGENKMLFNLQNTYLKELKLISKLIWKILFLVMA